MARRPDHPVDSSPTFFIDRCLGQGDVADALRACGESVELHDAHFPIDCPDEQWLMVVAARSWVVLTKDKRVRRRPAEVEALKASRAAVFVLTGGMMSGPAMAAALVAALPRMKRILATHTRPLLGLVAASGATTVAIGERRGGRRRSVDREGAEGDG